MGVWGPEFFEFLRYRIGVFQRIPEKETGFLASGFLYDRFSEKKLNNVAGLKELRITFFIYSNSKSVLFNSQGDNIQCVLLNTPT